MAIDLATHAAARAPREICISPGAQEIAIDLDVVDAARALSDEIMREVWPHIDDPSFYDAVLQSTIDNLAAIFHVMAGGEVSSEPPAAAMEFAEVTARMGVPIGEVDKAYRIGTGALWNIWFDVARGRAGSEPLDELISGPTLAIHAHVNRTLDLVAARHEEIRAEMHRTLSERHRRTVLDLLEGDGDADPETVSRQLDYRLEGAHLALLVETTTPDAVAAELRSAVDAGDTLLLQHGARSWVMWLGRTKPFEPKHLSKLARLLEGSRLTAAVGEPGSGVDGLRRTRRQAIETARVQRAFNDKDHRVLWARDVRLETLLLADESRARDFIADELGCLAAADAGNGRLRDTLLAWLATGSCVGAAALLHVHENTVRNRIRAAEELLGSSLLGRRTELQVALRLERVLNGPVAEGGGDLVAAA